LVVEDQLDNEAVQQEHQRVTLTLQNTDFPLEQEKTRRPRWRPAS
jgi:hypothetical protein